MLWASSHKVFWMTTSRHYFRLSPMGLLLWKQTPSLTTFFSAFLVLTYMDLNIMCLRAQIIKSLESLWRERAGEIVHEVVNAHASSSFWMNFCGNSNLSPRRVIKSMMLSSALCLVSINSRTSTHHWVLMNYWRNFCSTACQLTMDPSRRFAYQVKAASSSDHTKSCNCTKSCNNNAPCIAGGPYRRGPHLEM